MYECFLFIKIITQVERLVDRLQSSTLLNDRRDACRALKALSRTYRVEVGTRGMDVLRQILEIDRTDCEIIGLALDTLCNITNPVAFEEEGNITYLMFFIKLLLHFIYYFQWINMDQRIK